MDKKETDNNMVDLIPIIPITVLWNLNILSKGI